MTITLTQDDQKEIAGMTDRELYAVTRITYVNKKMIGGGDEMNQALHDGCKNECTKRQLKVSFSAKDDYNVIHPNRKVDFSKLTSDQIKREKFAQALAASK